MAKYTMANIVILQLWKLKEGQISSLFNLEVDYYIRINALYSLKGFFIFPNVTI